MVLEGTFLVCSLPKLQCHVSYVLVDFSLPQTWQDHLQSQALTLQPPASPWKKRLKHAQKNMCEMNNKGNKGCSFKTKHPQTSKFVHSYLLLRKICFACLIIFSRSPSLDCNELISFLSKAWGPESLILLWPKGALAGWGIVMELKVCLWNWTKNSCYKPPVPTD